jgi:capsular exopolysaccharide synthesis family protein
VSSLPGSNLQGDRWTALLFRTRAVLRRYWWLLLLTTAIGLGAGAIFVSRQETWHRSSAKMMVSGRVHITEGNAYSEEGANFFGTQRELMKSAQVRNQAEARVKAAGRVPVSDDAQFEVNMLPDASIFVLRVTAQNAEYSQALLEAIIEEYIGLKRNIRADKSEATLLALSDELMRSEKDSEEGEVELAKFQQTHSLVFLREGENTAAKYLASLNDRLAVLTTQLHLFEQVDLDQLRGLQPAPATPKPAGADAAPDASAAAPAKESPPEFISQGGYLKARQELLLLEQKREQLLEVKREGHPDLIAIEEEIAAKKRLLTMLREQSREEFEVQRKSLLSQTKAIEGEIEIWRGKAVEIGGLLGEYNRLSAKVNRAKALHERLMQNVGTVGLTKTLDQDIISVLERPSAPVPVRPGIERMLAGGGVAGLLLGLLVLYLLDRNSSEIISPEEFATHFRERVIGLVPAEPTAKEPLQVSDGRHAFAEAFYHIRSSLLFLDYDGPMPKTLLITSAVPNEGKSTLSTNIALAFAFAGSKTLLIDGDLRRGQIHRLFHTPNQRGFSDVIQGTITPSQAIVPTTTPNLHLMPRGPLLAQPSKFLVHSSTDALMQSLHQDYDQIIIDSCPVLAADDTTSLAPKVEAVVVVARVGVATRRHVAIALNWLESRQANILGVVLNGIDPRATSYNYYTYSNYDNHEANEGAPAASHPTQV